MVEQCKRRSSRLKGVAASKGRAVKAVKMGCEMSSNERPVEAEIKIEITGNMVEVKELVTSRKEACEDNCDICMEAEAKLAESRRLRRRREYRARRKQRQRAEKAARRDLQRESLGNSLGGSLGGSLGENSEQSTATQPSIPNHNSGKNLPPNIVELITIEDSESEAESEFIKLIRKYGSFN